MLSLPSFVWFKADYTPQQNRYYHTCQVVGSRQMLTFGGIDWAQTIVQPDIFELGIGIFDMTAMQWSDSYDATAAKYETPTVIKDYINANGPTPSAWSNATLAQIFVADASGDTTASASASASSTANAQLHSTSISGGAIAGIVVGAIAGITIIALVSWFLVRRRRRSPQPEGQSYQPERDQGEQYQPPPSYHQPPEKDTPVQATYAHYATDPVYEVDARPALSELPSQERYELHGGGDDHNNTPRAGQEA